MLDPFSLPFFQRAVVEVLVLALGAGLLGTWIVLRGHAFFAHAVGTATFPGLVLADGLGFSATLGAFGTAIVVVLLVGWLGRREGGASDSTTALVLAGALAIGVVLASDVYASQANVDTLLFGSLLAIDGADILLAAVAAVAVALAAALLGPRWLTTGFDPGTARAQGLRSPVPDVVLLGLIALTAVAALSAVGALLATALLVVPAATTRLLTQRVRPWQLATVALAAGEGVGGLWLSFQTNAPPGATIAVLNGALFALAALWRVLGPRRARAAALTGAVLCAVVVAGCGGSNAGGSGAGKLEVVATTTQLGDFARAVGGADVHVTQLLQANSDPHEYEPRPADVKALAGAKVVLTSGLGLDHWVDGVARDAGAEHALVDVGASVPDKAVGAGRKPDPHWWGEPANVEAATRTIAASMAKAEPARRDAVERRAAAYGARVASLRDRIRRCFATVPPAERKLVTDHDAFAYFARAFDVRIVGAVIPSLTTQAQPSAGELADLSRVIRSEHVKAVFPESSVNPRLARSIAAQTGAKVGASLYADTLGRAGSPGATYLGAEAFNADAMMRGFTGGARGCPSS